MVASLAMGGALGNDIAQLTAYANAPTLMAFIIVMKMVAQKKSPEGLQTRFVDLAA